MAYTLFQQTFSLTDIPQVFILGFLEWLLSADNAVVIALLIRPLSPAQRKTALIIGIGSAFLFRALGIGAIAYLIRSYWIELLGAGYLIFLSIQYFRKAKKKRAVPQGLVHFWKTVILIEILDLAFALDSIVSGIAFIAPYEIPFQPNPKLWLIYAGGMIGLIGIRFAADFFSQFIDRFPKIEASAHLMILWIALRLLSDSLFKAFSIDQAAYPLLQPLFWTGILVLFFLGFIKMNPKKPVARNK